ncbi:nucleotidyltransferase family protein [Haliscomenobacter sp.]|uniref:nucleotidyltransferase family protein n=1 Tax=Haliscomenobacter sp. TaxID=2717303 RepID=UPI003593B53D
MGLFRARKKNADSDIDILAEFSEPVGWEMVDLASELEELLGYKVDLVSKKAVKPNLIPFVIKSVVYI